MADEKIYTLTLNEKDVAVVITALSRQTVETVAATYVEVSGQLTTQGYRSQPAQGYPGMLPMPKGPHALVRK